MKRPFLLVDANVLIDYVKSEPAILTLTTEHIGSVMVPLPVLQEVQQLDEKTCTKLGITIVEPELRDLSEAALRRDKGSLSTTDRLCIVLAIKNSWTCVTNDVRMRKACDQNSVAVLWGLELMLRLVGLGKLNPEKARETGKSIRKENPIGITERVLQDFIKKVENSS